MKRSLDDTGKEVKLKIGSAKKISHATVGSGGVFFKRRVFGGKSISVFPYAFKVLSFSKFYQNMTIPEEIIKLDILLLAGFSR